MKRIEYTGKNRVFYLKAGRRNKGGGSPKTLLEKQNIVIIIIDVPKS